MGGPDSLVALHDVEMAQLLVRILLGVPLSLSNNVVYMISCRGRGTAWILEERSDSVFYFDDLLSIQQWNRYVI